MPNLKVRDGGKEYLRQVNEDIVSIGRGPSNAIDIQDVKASKDHCRLELVGDRWQMVDLESKNGTRVNGQFRNKAWLDHGDVVQIGKAEVEFSLAGARHRAGDAPAPTASRSGPRGVVRDDDGEERAPRRYSQKSRGDLALIGSLVVLGIVVVFFVATKLARSLEPDAYNKAVLVKAEELVGQGRWEDAREYLIKNGRPEGNSYPMVQRRIRELQIRTPDVHEDRAELEARSIFSKLTRKLLAYNQGSSTATPEEVLRLVEKLKTKYAGTEQTATARKEYPAWFAGKVPKRASDFMASGSNVRKSWSEAVASAKEYEKEWRFREARETIERFLSVHEAILDASDVDHYREQVEENLRRLDLAADGIYRAQERLSWDLLKNRRYDQAMGLFRKVVEKFGIDAYVRKAQKEIEKIEAKKRTDGGS